MPKVKTSRAFKRRLKKKSRDAQRRVADAVTCLRMDPAHPGLRVHRVRSRDGVYEARLDKGNRLTFHWDEEEQDTIVLRANCSHDEVLRRP